MNVAGIGSARRIVGKDGSAAPLDDFVRVVGVNLIGAYNMSRLFAAACARLDPLEGGERGVMLFTASVAAFDGQVGPAGLQRVQGRHRGHDAADGARPGAARHPRLHHRAGPVRDAAADGAAGAVLQSLAASIPFPPRLGKPSEFAELACHIVTNWPPERRGDPARRRAAMAPR